MSLLNLSRAKLSGTWDPAPVAISGVDALVLVGRPFYQVVGDVVVCDCVVNVDPATGGLYRFGLQVPVPRPVFASPGDAVGCANPSGSGGYGGAVLARAGELVVDVDSANGVGTALDVPIRFSYRAVA